MSVEITMKGDAASLQQMFAVLAGVETKLPVPVKVETPIKTTATLKRAKANTSDIPAAWKERAMMLCNLGEPFKLNEVCTTDKKRVRQRFVSWLQKSLGAVVEVKDPSKQPRGTNPYIVLPKPLVKTPQAQAASVEPASADTVEQVVHSVVTAFGSPSVASETPHPQSGTIVSPPHTGLSARSNHHIPEHEPEKLMEFLAS